MSVRLLALDLDGTLLDSHGQLSNRNRTAIARARGAGVRVALVTGRRFRDARPLALELGLDVPVICHNGALTKHARTLATVAVMTLPLAAAQAALRVGRSFGADALVSDDTEGPGVLVYDHLSGDNPALLRYVAWARSLHGDKGNDAVHEVPALEAYLNHDPIHLAFSGTCVAMKHLQEILRRELGGTVKIFRTTYPQKDFALLDIVHPEVSKGVGVAAAAVELGIQREEVMAIGDNLNDLEMLRYAGIGVAMANAEVALLQLPGLQTTASNDHDGVAIAIEDLILHSQ